MEITGKETGNRMGNRKDSQSMAQEKRELKRILTIPNLMSAARILLVPFFAAFYLSGHVAAAAGALVLSGLTDMLDGWVARRFDQVTELGKILDPFADKLTQGVVAVCIALRFPAIRPFLLLFIVKELSMLCCAGLLLKKHKRPCAAKWYGKAATVMFYISIAVIVIMDGAGLMKPDSFNLWAHILLGLTAVMMVYAAVRYFRIFRAILRGTAPEAEKKEDNTWSE